MLPKTIKSLEGRPQIVIPKISFIDIEDQGNSRTMMRYKHTCHTDIKIGDSVNLFDSKFEVLRPEHQSFYLHTLPFIGVTFIPHFRNSGTIKDDQSGTFTDVLYCPTNCPRSNT